MAEKIISPGVFTTEIDQSFLPAAIGDIGAAVIGPTVKGPALVPTVVESYAEFEQKFGSAFLSGSSVVQYFTSHFAQNYLRHAGKLTVVRILDGAFSEATASVADGGSATTGNAGSASLTITDGGILGEEVTIGAVDFIFVSGSSQSDVNDRFTHQASEIYVSSGSENVSAANMVLAINDQSSVHNLGISASAASAVVSIFTGSYNLASSSNNVAGGVLSWGTSGSMSGATAGTSATAFTLHTHGDGVIMNNVGATGANNTLKTGSADNIRWEISSQNVSKGTFNLMIRSGNDSQKRKNSLESWNNLSLDPNSKNYISKMIGDSKLVFKKDDDGMGYLQSSGSFPNKSKYVWVEGSNTTIDYLDDNGVINDLTAYQKLPASGSGSVDGAFGGGSNGYAGFNSLGEIDGTNSAAAHYLFYNGVDIDYYAGFKPGGTTCNTDGQCGYSSYSEALDLLANADEYDINMIALPGITNQNASAVVNKALTTCENRGDCFVIADPTNWGAMMSTAITQAEAYDSNYGAMYYPWVQINDVTTGQFRWVPPSVVMGGIYAFNDKVAHPWFAPAGLNRGGIETAIQAERKLTHSNRDDLYDANMNPIATFPGQGVTVWGQKTLQKKASALDRINVRRLLIKVKKFIAASSRFLVFEQNNANTRKRFLNIANPYLEQVQSQSGLSAFRVVMDDSNNTPDLVDRNILYGQLFLQPTRTAEFIVLDFTIQPTGASFPE